MDISTQNFLVTGGCGFIGSHITEYLLKNGAKFVRVIDNLSTGSLKNIKHLEKYPNFEFVWGSITDYDFCLNVTKDINIVCHQAALGSVPNSLLNPLKYHETNVTGFLNILEACRVNNIKRFVYASSSSVYGDNTDKYKLENKTGKQLSPYAINKYFDDMYAELYTRIYHMECIGLRYFNVFGPRQNPNGAYAAVIPKFIQSLKNNIAPTIYGDGKQSRDFTYVDNVVFANYCAMTVNNNECYGQTFNIGLGDSISVLDLYYKIADELNIDYDPIFADKREGDILHSLANNNKAILLLGWYPIVTLDKGLENTICSF